MNQIPALDLQKQFFQAISHGDLIGMKKAVKAGADPKAPSSPQQVSAWLYAALHAPLSTMNEMFSLFEAWNIERRCGPFDFPESHPCIELTLRTRARANFEHEERGSLKQTIHHGYTLAWKMWEALEQQERRRVLLTIDARAWRMACQNRRESDRYTQRVKDIWREPPSLKGFYSDEFRFLRNRLRLKTGASSVSTLSQPRLPLLSEETLFWCLQSLCADHAHGDIGSIKIGHHLSWGFHFLTAPEPVLKGCLKHEAARKIILEKIVEHAALHLHSRRGANPPVFSYENTYAQLIRRFHTQGAPWPEAWPEAARTCLMTFPAILRFSEQAHLTRTLKQDAPSGLSAASPSLRVRL